MKAYGYYKPQTVEDAIDLMKKLEDARFIAGGTDVLVLLRQKKISPANLISLRNIQTLSGIEIGDHGLWIGGCTTHSDIVKNDYIKHYFSALHDATRRLGSCQIRNVATIGGNICNAAPSADTACPLLVFDADVVIAGSYGKKQVHMDDFFLGPNRTVLEDNEIVQGFQLPLFGDGTGSAYIKHTRRKAMDLPILGIAARITIIKEDDGFRCRDARIAMGVVAPRPVRAKGAEEILKSMIITDELLDRAADAASAEARPRDSIRGEAWYRREMVKVLTRRAVATAMERALGLQGEGGK